MKTMIPVLRILLCFACVVSASWAADDAHIHLNRDANLKAIFDAGLRPWRVKGLTKYECEFGATALSLAVGDKEPFPFSVERASISVLDNNVLSSVNLFGPREPIPVALERIKSACRSLGMSDQGLAEIANSVGNMPDPSKRWFTSTVIESMRVGITFYPLFALHGTTDAQVWLTINWKFPDGTYKFLKEPIKPPVGYENESMDPPPLDLSGKPFPETYVPPRSSDPGKNSPVTAQPPAKASTPIEPQEKSLQSIPCESARPSWWPWAIGGLLLLALVVFHFRKSK